MAEEKKRTRRTKAQIEADKAAAELLATEPTEDKLKADEPKADEPLTYFMFANSRRPPYLREIKSLDEAEPDEVVTLAPKGMQFPMVKRLVMNTGLRIYKLYRGK